MVSCDNDSIIRKLYAVSMQCNIKNKENRLCNKTQTRTYKSICKERLKENIRACKFFKYVLKEEAVDNI